jgi:hypothetical protein
MTVGGSPCTKPKNLVNIFLSSLEVAVDES